MPHVSIFDRTPPLRLSDMLVSLLSSWAPVDPAGLLLAHSRAPNCRPEPGKRSLELGCDEFATARTGAVPLPIFIQSTLPEKHSR